MLVQHWASDLSLDEILWHFSLSLRLCFPKNLSKQDFQYLKLRFLKSNAKCLGSCHLHWPDPAFSGRWEESPVSLRQVSGKLVYPLYDHRESGTTSLAEVLHQGGHNPLHQYVLGVTGWQQLGSKGPWGSGWHQGVPEPTMCSCGKVGRWYPWLH